MDSLWNDAEAADYAGDLGLRVYTSQLLGRNPELVLHGGGNTSVKLRAANLFGDEEEVIWVKGSGHDLATIGEDGFAPLRLRPLQRMAKLPELSDTRMMEELRTHTLKGGAPDPSVEALLHALLPYKFVDHTHADAILTLTNSVNGLERVKKVFGSKVVVIPYVMPGFELAKLCAQRFPTEMRLGTIGMVLMNHGLFSFGESARQSYERMIELVTLAEEHLKKQQAWEIPVLQIKLPDFDFTEILAGLRYAVSQAAGFPLVMLNDGSDLCKAFAWSDVGRISQQGPITPNHASRTKPWPMVGHNIDGFVERYQAYFAAHAQSHQEMLDPAPRVVLDSKLGMCTLGRSVREAGKVADIYRHTMEVILRAEALGGYVALPPAEVFAVEYWELELAKYRQERQPLPFAGEIVLVTGAASGIGKACVEGFLSQGAVVVGLDVDLTVDCRPDNPAFMGVVCDITDDAALKKAVDDAVYRFGGLDMLVLNAGIFPKSRRIAELAKTDWRRVMGVNLDANLSLLREVHPMLKLAPRGGRVVVIGSKNVPAPGPGAAAYSASKAALNQLARVAALEWGADRIRVNSLHPNAVFDTAIWTPEVLASRAKQYNLTVEQYKTNNLLRVEVTSRDVAELTMALCSPLFAKTTGAQIPVDGGNDRVV